MHRPLRLGLCQFVRRARRWTTWLRTRRARGMRCERVRVSEGAEMSTVVARFMIWKSDEELNPINASILHRIPRSGVFAPLRCALCQRDAFVVVEMGARGRQNRLRSRDRQRCKEDSLGEFARSARR